MTVDVLPSDSSPAPSVSGSARLLACYQQALGHELPNQLVAIQGLARMLQLEAGEILGNDAESTLTRLIQLTQETHHFVNAVSEIGRCCRPATPTVTVSLAETWEEIVAEVKTQFPGREVRCPVEGPLPSVLMPFTAVRRVFAEVVRAAIRRTPVDMPLTIRLTPLADSPGVCIRDDGPPLTALQRQQLFDPFAAAPGQKSPAVGLFLARQLAEGWGGRLNIDSAPDAGCTTTIEFPTTDSPASDSAS